MPATALACLLDQLGQQLAQEFGRGFESRNLRRMVKFAEAFPDVEIVSTLSTQLSWSHLVAIVALKTPEARAFFHIVCHLRSHVALCGNVGCQVTACGSRTWFTDCVP